MHFTFEIWIAWLVAAVIGGFWVLSRFCDCPGGVASVIGPGL